VKNKIENMQHVLYDLVVYIHKCMSKRVFPTVFMDANEGL